MSEMTTMEIIDVVDARAGDFRPRQGAVKGAADEAFAFLESVSEGKRVTMSLREALLQQPDAGVLLRDGIRTIAFNEYAATAVTYPQFVRVQPSSKPEEYYLRDGAMGRVPRVPSGSPAPRLTRRLEGSAVVQNFKYDAVVSILGDDIRFDRLNIIRQTAEVLGRSGRLTEEAEVYSVIANSANYTRTAAAGDNDVDANAQNWTLTHENFEKALAIVATAKDRTSGQYLGLQPDTLIVGPLMKYPAMKLLASGNVVLAGTAAGTTSVGDLNVYRGALTQLVVSPYLTTSYDWLVCDSKAPGVIFQQVEPFNVYQQTMTPDNVSWLTHDELLFKIMGYFGVGFTDDRGWFYSASTTRPTV